MAGSVFRLNRVNVAMAKRTNRQLWEMGIPLGEAWLKFANDDARERLINQPGWLQTLENAVGHVSGLSGLASVVNDAFQTNAEKRRIELEMQEDLLDRLFDGELMALGFRIFPSRSAAPVAIDASFFEFLAIGWADNSAAFEGKRYAQIRIIERDADFDVSAPLIGRPSSGGVILAAIDELMADQEMSFCSLPRKIACAKIRHKISHQEISGNGLSDKNLSKYILQKCQRRQIK